jgi:hypothetical protein
VRGGLIDSPDRPLDRSIDRAGMMCNTWQAS